MVPLHSLVDSVRMKITCRQKEVVNSRPCYLAQRLMFFSKNITQCFIWCKVSGPNLVTHPKGSHLFECCVLRCEFKNIHQRDMCLNETRLRSQNLLIILGSIVNIIWVPI